MSNFNFKTKQEPERKVKSGINWLGIIAIVIALGGFIYLKMSARKIYYVKTGEIIAKYEGTKGAQEALKKKQEVWQSNIDTLEISYNNAFAEFNKISARLNGKELNERKETIKKRNMELQKYKESIYTKAKQEEEQTTQGVLNQINTLIESYCKKKDYTLVLGTTSTGSILYADEGMDITKEILEELNKNYAGSKK